MLDYLWGAMLMIGIVYGFLTGNVELVTDAILNSAGEAVSICITMTGVMSLWVGLMEIARQAGLIAKMTKAINPAIRFLFPNIPRNHVASEYIATNCIANILGLGWAATPAGLKAMEALAQLEAERGTPGYVVGDNKGQKKEISRRASNEMCNFLILNISSLQLIPVNIIAYRSQYGSVDPAAVIAPAIVANLVNTLAAILYCKWKDRGVRY